MTSSSPSDLDDHRPLGWLRVVDCSTGTAGTRATGLLADLGADVIWVEPPGGDPYRDELAVEYSVANRGKRSVELDLSTARGRNHLADLVRDADVFVRSWRPGVAADLGVDYSDLRSVNPRLVYCSITGFGETGPYRDVRGYESLVHALAGSMYDQEGFRGGPIYEALPSATYGASYLAVIGILAALFRRDRDGLGRHVETSLYDGVLAYMLLWGTNQRRGEHSTSGNRSVCRNIRCGDDRFIAVHTGAVGAFNRLMAEVGLAGRIVPSASGLDLTTVASGAESEILTKELPEIFLGADSATWVERLLRADVCGVVANGPGSMFDDAQVLHNGMIVEVDDPVLGRVQQTAVPLRVNGVRPTPLAGAPTVGENNESILRKPESCWRSGRTDPMPGDKERNSDDHLLSGVRILDLGAFYAGPYASRLLADFGAEVIKLEPLNGDPLRGFDVIFNSGQARKRAIAADLKTDEGREVGARLLQWADCVSHNMRPGVAERIGCGFEEAQAAQPSTVYAHAPGWGNSGPFRDRQSFAPILSVYIGLGHEVAGQYNEPIWPSASEDPGNGMVGAIALLIGLLRRNRGWSDAQFLENPQLNAAVAHASYMVRESSGAIRGAARLDTLQFGYSALDRVYETRDGWICLSVHANDEWDALCTWIAPDLGLDDRFLSADLRTVHDYELADHLGAKFASMRSSEIITVAVERALPIVIPVGKNESVMSLPHNVELGRVVRVADERQGDVLAFDHLIRVSDSRFAPFALAPDLGENTEAILTDLGFEPRHIRDLYSRGIVR